MFNKDLFKERIAKTQTEMKAFCRGELTAPVESSVIDELSKIYLTMADKFHDAALAGIELPILTRFASHPQDERAFYALEDLLERMELDFTLKFVNSVKHDMTKEIEVGKIQIAFLDSVRRSLHGARTH